MWSGDPPEIFDTAQADSLRTALRFVFSALPWIHASVYLPHFREQGHPYIWNEGLRLKELVCIGIGNRDDVANDAE